jgi:hypothetical protein
VNQFTIQTGRPGLHVCDALSKVSGPQIKILKHDVTQHHHEEHTNTKYTKSALNYHVYLVVGFHSVVPVGVEQTSAQCLQVKASALGKDII